ncbi:unnamed protein product [Symbiodinium microadriaticum]|nr:unnamed protein product [Symbiodinium microadriaticum]
MTSYCSRSCGHVALEIHGLTMAFLPWRCWHGVLHTLSTLALSFLAGYADVITYMRYGSFAASMTGNVVFAGRELAKGSWDVFFYISIMASWALGSSAYTEVARQLRISTAVDVGYNISAYNGASSRWWILGLMPVFGVAEAFALQHLSLPTTGVAKHLFNLSRLCELFRKETADTVREDVMLSGVMICGMIGGAVLGERLVATFGLQVRWCFMPVSPLVALAVCMHEWLHSWKHARTRTRLLNYDYRSRQAGVDVRRADVFTAFCRFLDSASYTRLRSQGLETQIGTGSIYQFRLCSTRRLWCLLGSLTMGNQSSRVAPAGVVPSADGGVVVNVVNVARSENKSGTAIATILLDQNDEIQRCFKDAASAAGPAKQPQVLPVMPSAFAQQIQEWAVACETEAYESEIGSRAHSFSVPMLVASQSGQTEKAQELMSDMEASLNEEVSSKKISPSTEAWMLGRLLAANCHLRAEAEGIAEKLRGVLDQILARRLAQPESLETADAAESWATRPEAHLME